MHQISPISPTISVTNPPNCEQFASPFEPERRPFCTSVYE
jgi:hypothetical protein